MDQKDKNKSIHSIVADADTLLSLHASEVGAIILEALNSRIWEDSINPNAGKNYFHAGNVFSQEVGRYSDPHRPNLEVEVQRALMEGWNWLVTNAFVAPDLSTSPFGGFFVTRPGRRYMRRVDLTRYVQLERYPSALLHERIRTVAWEAFIRSQFDTAVFQAFKEVEIAVRDAAKLQPTDIGVPLMRKAFNKDGGPLTDQAVPEGERQALSDLFAGAIGSYKNPHSHRTVTISDSLEAFEMLGIASHLLRIVDTR